MAGKNPLLVAKQHEHGVNTMLEVYAAWIEGAKESMSSHSAGDGVGLARFGAHAAGVDP